mmetsp:Transcript_5269/g.7734  ORF Transcript_5269/g.7734 Transcript_5269/m.7734 type:complete len:174 (-) Transcript_5269:3276-3797(-)
MLKNKSEKQNENELILDKSLQTGFKREREESDESPESDEEAPPEDAIPDLPENKEAREFLKNAPSKGLFMPLGKEVKVMQCWRCKAFGHRTGDRECPLTVSGNEKIETQRQAREDPMSRFVSKKSKLRQEKYERVEQLKQLIADIRKEEKERKRRKEERKLEKKKKKKNKIDE